MEWVKRGDRQAAITDKGEFLVERVEPGRFRFEHRGHVLGDFSSEEEAKAAAQREYDRE